MSIRQQAYLTCALMAIVRRGRAALASRSEEGAIPAEVAWIAGIVVLALGVIVILTAVTTGAANNIKLK